MTNEEIVLRIQTGENDLMPVLWEQVRRFVASKAMEHLAEHGTGGGVAFDDLYNTGFLALPEAVRTYKEKGKSFVGWYKYYIQKAFGDLCGYRTQRSRRDPINCAVSLSSTIGGDNGEGELSDVIPDPEGEWSLWVIEDEMFLKQLKSTVRQVLDEIPDEMAVVIRKRYIEGLTAEQTGQNIGISKYEVGKREDAALRLLRRNKYAHRLRPFYECDSCR